MVMPRNRCSLKIGLTSLISAAALGCKVTMPCAQFMNFTISWPSRCCAETGMVSRPSVHWSHSSSRIAMSPELEVGLADARVEQAAVRKQRDADPARNPCDTARSHRHELLE